MFDKHKNRSWLNVQFALLAVSAILYVLYFMFWRTVNLFWLIKPDMASQYSISQSVFVFILPLLLISILPSYISMKSMDIRETPLFTRAVVFSIFYILFGFTSIVILFALGV
jgi:hypothetical protein